MDMPYRDKHPVSSMYRAVLMFRSVGIAMVIVVIAAFFFPDDDGFYIIAGVAVVCALGALIYQIRADLTLIHTGELLIDDGKDLYVMLGSFNLGFGRGHHMRKRVKSHRVYYLKEIKKIREYSFGVAIRAVTYTASDKKLAELDDALFETTGAMKALLEEKGKKKTMLLRLERSLRAEDEAAFLKRLEGMKRKI